MSSRKIILPILFFISSFLFVLHFYPSFLISEANACVQQQGFVWDCVWCPGKEGVEGACIPNGWTRFCGTLTKQDEVFFTPVQQCWDCASGPRVCTATYCATLSVVENDLDCKNQDPNNPNCIFVQWIKGSCLLPNGSSCSTGSQCAGGYCCNSVCQSTACCKAPGQACTLPSECCSGTCNSGLCGCYTVGQNCSQNSQCCTNYCLSGKCAYKQDGSSCVNNYECMGGYCCNNICQSASCAPSCTADGSGCSAPSECCSGVCAGNICGGSICKSSGTTCGNNYECCGGFCNNGHCECIDNGIWGCNNNSNCCSGCCGFGNICQFQSNCACTCDYDQARNVCIGSTYNNSCGNPTCAGAKQCATYQLSVVKTGTGSGTVTSNPSGINCGLTCSSNFQETTAIILTPTPSSGSVFAGWSGDCSGTGACNVMMSQIRNITATFNLTMPPAIGYVKIKHPFLGILRLRLISFANAKIALKGIVKVARFNSDINTAADLVETNDPNASPVRIKTPYGIKAWRMQP